MSFPISESDPVVFDAPLPERADVVVIGGGVAGVMSALFLRRAGLQVVLLEKGRIAAEQSSRNWGWIRAQGRDLAELPIAMEARRLWAEIAPQCDVDIGLRQTGVTYLADNDAAMEGYAAWAAGAQDAGLDCRILDAAGAASLVPGAAQSWVGAITTPTDMRAEPWVAVPAVARLAAAEGVQIVERCAVRGLDVAAGRVAGVITEKGRITAREVVVAGGAWSRLLLQRHDIAIPQLSVRSTAVATGPLPQVFEGQAADKRVAFRRRQDGGYTIASGGPNELYLGRDAFASVADYWPALGLDPLGVRLMPGAPAGYPDAWRTPRRWDADKCSPFERQRVLNPAPNMRRVNAALRAFGETFPALGRVTAQKAWAGMIDTMPDFVPVLDRGSALRGLTIATGLSGHGFGIGPGIGKIAAQLIAGETPSHDISRFRLSRFAEEAPLELGPTL